MFQNRRLIWRCAYRIRPVGLGIILLFAVPALGGPVSTDPYDFWQWHGAVRTSQPSTTASNTVPFVTSLGSSVVVSSGGTASLSGFVYVDANGDHTRNGTDRGIAGAQVSITPVDGSSPLASVLSGSDGSYNFAGLMAGSYLLSMVTPTTVASPDNGTSGLILGNNGTSLVSLQKSGTVTPNAYSGIPLQDGQAGTNFNFAQTAYPISLISKRMFLSSSAQPVNPNIVVPLLATNPGSGSTLAVNPTLVGTTGTANVVAQNVGDAGSALWGTFSTAGEWTGPDATSTFGPLGVGGSETRSYSYTPSQRGLATQPITVSSNGGDSTITLSCPGVAPRASVAPTALDAGYVLVGNIKTVGAGVTVQNQGDGNLSGLGEISNLRGSLANGTAPFSLVGGGSISLADGAQQTFHYNFTPTSRGANSTSVTADFKNGNPSGNNSAYATNVSLSGIGVAPLASVVAQNAGTVLVGTTKTVTTGVTVHNTGDGNLSGLGAQSNLNGALNSFSGGGFSLAGGPISLTDGSQQSFSYNYAPTVRGSSSTNVTANFSNGNPTGDNTPYLPSVPISGIGVAPVQQVDLAAAHAGFVRIGTSGSASVTVTNIGDGNQSGQGATSNLLGAVSAASGNFSGSGGGINLSDGAAQTLNFTYTPTTHSLDTSPLPIQFGNGSSDGANLPQNVNATLDGHGVGPVYHSVAAPDSTLDFGAVHLGSLTKLFLNISNVSTDSNGGNSALTDLTLEDITLSGQDKSLFQIVGFAPGTVLNEGGQLSLEVDYTGQGPVGSKLAFLTVDTDEGAPLGGSGSIFHYTVIATVVPEASSLVLVAMAGLSWCGLVWRRRRAARS